MKRTLFMMLTAVLMAVGMQAQVTTTHPWGHKRVAYFGDSITDPKNDGSKLS